ncbi:beta-glucosidase family protein [Dactylosporangium salmoneum]|uniref:Glycoside hydrolase family 3 C-terminal domain-containing protein n=1 Tax=Dactylosporangium salmoneum TaxID=53361 RepID=A0ABP5UTU9_9ACTN
MIERADVVPAALPLPAQVRLLSGGSFFRTAAEPAIGLGELVLSDGPVGPRGPYWDERSTTVLAPSPSALAATWDPALVERVGRALGRECRRMGVHVLLAPTVNLHRSPYGGRHFECFSEDPLLTGVVAAAYVRGVQSQGVAACVKHYVANDSETDRFTVDVRVDERTLRELYLAPFEAVVRAGVWAVMSAYNAVNGVTMTEHPLLDAPLRTEWGFDGLVVSDWTAVRSVRAAAVGQDLAMPGPSAVWGAPLVEAVRSGAVPAARIAEKLERLVRLAGRAGRPPSAEGGPDREAARALMRAALARGMVLLRNEERGGGPVLPLEHRAPASVALLGANVAHPRWQGGGSAGSYPERTVSPESGLRAALGSGAEVVTAAGCFLEDGPVPLTPADARDPVTGEGGVRVRYLDAAGQELRCEHRLAGKLLWLGDERLAGVAAIEVRALLDVDTTGDWEIAVGGFGHYVLALDGVPVVDATFAADGADPAAGLAAPPARGHCRPSVAGECVDVVVRYDVRHPQDPLDAELVWLAVRRPRRSAADELAHAVALAARASVAVVVVGTTERIESEGSDRATLALPGDQDALVRAVAAVNPRTVVVVNAGAPVLLPWAADVAAILLCWFPGQEFGGALADVLLGLAEPGGRLPTHWPAAAPDRTAVEPVDGVLDYREGLRVGHRAGPAPGYPFGFGLGYTTWSLVAAVAEPGPHGCTVRLRLRNTGARAGRQVVQAYLRRPESGLDRPVRWLAGFAAVEAGPGAEVDTRIDVAERAFQHWDVAAGTWRREPGEFVLELGFCSGDPLAELSVPGRG